MDKLFITICGLCALALAAGCAYRHFSNIDSDDVEILCSIAFLICSIIAFNTRKYCDNE